MPDRMPAYTMDIKELEKKVNAAISTSGNLMESAKLLIELEKLKALQDIYKMLTYIAPH